VPPLTAKASRDEHRARERRPVSSGSHRTSIREVRVRGLPQPARAPDHGIVPDLRGGADRSRFPSCPLAQCARVFADTRDRELLRVAQDYTSNLHDRSRARRPGARRGIRAGARARGRSSRSGYGDATDDDGTAPTTPRSDAAATRADDPRSRAATRRHPHATGRPETRESVRSCARCRTAGGVMGPRRPGVPGATHRNLPSGVDLCVLAGDPRDDLLLEQVRRAARRRVPRLGEQRPASTTVLDAAGHAVLVSRRELLPCRASRPRDGRCSPGASSPKRSRPPARSSASSFPWRCSRLHVAALLSATQIRRTLGPAARPADRTRKAADQDFSRPRRDRGARRVRRARRRVQCE
jgi:hypothetical protein